MKILMAEGIKTISDGYIKEIKVKGFSFLVMLHRPLGNDENPGWNCTEYTTGYKICSGSTRKAALEQAEILIVTATPEKTASLIASKEVLNCLPVKKDRRG